MTAIPLTTFSQTSGSETIFNQQDHGIRVSQKGWYLISAKAYYGNTFTANDITHLAVFNTEASTEPGIAHTQIRVAVAPESWFTIAIPSFIYEVSSTPIDFWLATKNQQGARGILAHNSTYDDGFTYLNIVKLK